MESSETSSTQIIKATAMELGFDLVGVAPAVASPNAEYVRQWLASGQAGNMNWMHKHVEKLLDVRELLSGARSILSVGLNYQYPLEAAAEETAGRIARYALGDDYHEVMKEKLHALADVVRAVVPGCETKCGVDSAPILEREIAAGAGIGWIGKNTCLIHPRMGSWMFLGEVVTTAELEPDRPVENHCGTCTRCIDACPTQAITQPYNLDARRCISYLTIEHRQELTPEQQGMIGNWLVGCDICQEVCPFNRKAPESRVAEFRPRFAEAAVALTEVLHMNAEAYRAKFRHSAVKRVKLPVLQGNARAIEANMAQRKGEG